MDWSLAGIRGRLGNLGRDRGFPGEDGNLGKPGLEGPDGLVLLGNRGIRGIWKPGKLGNCGTWETGNLVPGAPGLPGAWLIIGIESLQFDRRSQALLMVRLLAQFANVWKRPASWFGSGCCQRPGRASIARISRRRHVPAVASRNRDETAALETASPIRSRRRQARPDQPDLGETSCLQDSRENTPRAGILNPTFHRIPQDSPDTRQTVAGLHRQSQPAYSPGCSASASARTQRLHEAARHFGCASLEGQTGIW